MSDIESLPEEIKDVIESSQVVVFTKPKCSNCDVMKKTLAAQSNYEYRIVYVDTLNISYNDFIDSIIANTPVKTFPICFMHNNFISTEELNKKLTLSFKDGDIDNI